MDFWRLQAAKTNDLIPVFFFFLTFSEQIYLYIPEALSETQQSRNTLSPPSSLHDITTLSQTVFSLSLRLSFLAKLQTFISSSLALL